MLRRYFSRLYFHQATRRGLQTNVLQSRGVPPLAFAFDIDGVLMAGPDPLPTAKRALQILEGDNPLKSKIPYILLTNGGGNTEQQRAEKLSRSLGSRSDQIIQAHTILKDLVGKYGDSPVLVLGGKNDDMRFVAESYGFKKAYTTADVLLWNSSVWPFQSFDPANMKSRPSVDFSETRIDAILVFHDPRNWGTDVQIMCDVIQSDGIIGNPYIDPKSTSTQPVEVIFCNPDLLWKSDFPRPRLGQGAFRESFQAVYKAITGSTYPFVQFGKPTTPTYKYAEKVIQRIMKKLYGEYAGVPSMYMIGDNPASDITGANGAKWNSVLVHTGVYDPGLGIPPQPTPTQEAKDVEAAVKWAIERAIGRNQIEKY